MPTTRKTLKRRSGLLKTGAISLFSGAGGDSVGMEAAGYNVVAFSEMDSDAVNSHLMNLPHSQWIHMEGNGDITKIPDSVFAAWTGKIKLIFAGFPCTGFSIAGKRNDTDPRNELFEEFVRVVKIVKPTYIIGENVGRLLNVDDVRGETSLIELIQEKFKAIGYHISWKIIKATDAGIPQVRRRLLIVGCRNRKVSENFPWEELFPETQVVVPVKPILKQHLRGAVPLTKEFAHKLEKDFGSDEFWIRARTTIATGTPHSLLDNLVREKRLCVGKRDKSLGEGGEIMDPSEPSKVVTTAYFWQPRFFVGLRDSADKYWVRTLDEEELALIQGFPPGWKFVGSERKRIMQIGNAVPAEIVRRIASHLIAL